MQLETARLILSPATAAHRDDLIALERDAEVMRYINGGKPTARADAGFLTPRGGEAGVWAATEKDRRAFIGWFSLQSAGDGSVATLGYRLRRTAWGRGYGGEGAGALVAAGFRALGYQRIRAETMAVNLASRRVMEKAGLTYRRTRHLDWPDPLPGSEHGDVEYQVTREDWLARADR